MSTEPVTVSIANKGKASVWTEEAKYELLLRIIHQLKQGKLINWGSIKMRDRNTKSLTNQWTRIGKDMAALEDLDDGATAGTPTPKKGTATKRKTAVKEEDEDGAVETPVKKRGRTTAVKKEINLAAVKKEEEACSSDEI